jgi:hypothetical protein
VRLLLISLYFYGKVGVEKFSHIYRRDIMHFDIRELNFFSRDGSPFKPRRVWSWLEFITVLGIVLCWCGISAMESFRYGIVKQERNMYRLYLAFGLINFLSATIFSFALHTAWPGWFGLALYLIVGLMFAWWHAQNLDHR